MLIGILQCGHFPKADNYPDRDYTALYSQFLDGHGFAFRTWSVVDMEFPESANEAQGWLVTGSKHGAYEDLPFIRPLEDFICRAYAKSVPLVGICFGHQIIAQALGGRVEKFSGGWVVGRQTYAMEEGEALHLNAWHQDQVVERPARATRLGSGPASENAFLSYEGKALTMQPHPEFDDEVMNLLIEHRAIGNVPDDQVQAARASVGAPVDNGEIANRVAAFFKETAGGG